MKVPENEPTFYNITLHSCDIIFIAIIGKSVLQYVVAELYRSVTFTAGLDIMGRNM